ncbi:PIN domain-containing protein [uncultured Polaribacter sp.]|uniref:type II toxin-antitoxin system VapC family toxin n=1 Tax=uncultured Polaribacter sp. TaxID=174711 RepID=UPI00261D576C|nr:PIN domain-containing protein [uncultured Polaribacter sp.]
MKNIFIDTNVIIDFITQRKPFDIEANKIFSLADNKIIFLQTSSLSLANAYYIFSKSKLKNDKELRKIFINLRTLIDITPITSTIIDRSLIDELFSDFEDGLQYFAALKSNCDCIITRNLKHFKNSKISVFSPERFIKEINF